VRLFPDVEAAKDEDWYAEYLDLILAVRIVENLDEAVAHIEKYGSSTRNPSSPGTHHNSQGFSRGQLLDGSS